eukprot:3609946-Pyramimonas_sp.AAC.1
MRFTHFWTFSSDGQAVKPVFVACRNARAEPTAPLREQSARVAANRDRQSQNHERASRLSLPVSHRCRAQYASDHPHYA